MPYRPQQDLEMNRYPTKEDRLSVAAGSSYTMRDPAAYDQPAATTGPRRVVDRWVDSLRRDPSLRITPKMLADDGDGFAGGFGADPGGPSRHAASSSPSSVHARHGQGPYYDMRMAAIQTSHSGLLRKLKGRHLQMIAIGGSIGTGLFVASGRALELGGPASLLVAYMWIGSMLYFTMQALGELAVAFPVAGSFSAYSTRFLHPSWGFAMGWNYALQWLLVLPLEIIAATITISFWDRERRIRRAVFVTLFLIIILVINMFGVEGYGEAEFIFALVKVIAVIGFILLGVVLNIGGVPGGGYIGWSYWQSPGAFHNGFKGLCNVFVMAAFAFAGTELVGLAAAETVNPRKSLPTAIKQVFWRITIFYVLSLALIGLLVPYDDRRLLQGPSDPGRANNGPSASPFVIAIENAGIGVLPSVMNAVILIAVLSVGNSAVFGSSRTLAALADQRQAPRFLAYIDRRGRPLFAIMVAAAVGTLAYLADLRSQAVVLDWLLSGSGLSCVFTWASICLVHIRFRRAWEAQGHSLRELPFTSQSGVWGSWLGLIFNLLVLAAQFWVGARPIGYEDLTARQLAENFFLQYMAVPIVLVMFLGHRMYFRTSLVRIQDMDVTTGRRDFNLSILLAQEAEERRAWPRWKSIYKFLC